MRRQGDKEMERQETKSADPHGAACNNANVQKSSLSFRPEGEILLRSGPARFSTVMAVRAQRNPCSSHSDKRLRYPFNSRSKRRQESSSRLGRTHFPARAQCRCNLR
jgi:hypothetical protein